MIFLVLKGNISLVFLERYIIHLWSVKTNIFTILFYCATNPVKNTFKKINPLMVSKKETFIVFLTCGTFLLSGLIFYIKRKRSFNCSEVDTTKFNLSSDTFNVLPLEFEGEWIQFAVSVFLTSQTKFATLPMLKS